MPTAPRQSATSRKSAPRTAKPKTPAATRAAAAKTVKQPTDRRPPAGTPQDITITVDDLTVTVSAEVMDDLELLEDLAAVDAGDELRSFAALRRMLGDAQYDQVKEHYRDPNTGRVVATKVAAWMQEMFEAEFPNS